MVKFWNFIYFTKNKKTKKPTYFHLQANEVRRAVWPLRWRAMYWRVVPPLAPPQFHPNGRWNVSLSAIRSRDAGPTCSEGKTGGLWKITDPGYDNTLSWLLALVFLKTTKQLLPLWHSPFGPWWHTRNLFGGWGWEFCDLNIWNLGNAGILSQWIQYHGFHKSAVCLLFVCCLHLFLSLDFSLLSHQLSF